MSSVSVATVQKITLKDSDVNEVYAIQCFNQKNPNQQIKKHIHMIYLLEEFH